MNVTGVLRPTSRHQGREGITSLRGRFGVAGVRDVGGGGLGVALALTIPYRDDTNV